MQVPHNAFVLVADGRKMLFFRNEGDGEHPNLVVEHAEEHANPKDSDQKTDLAGGASSTNAGSFGGGGAGASMGEVDFHQQEEDRFAAEAAEMLRKRALANAFEQLIIVAPPKTLGELRKHYHKEVESRLAGELAKDLTGHPVPEIEAALKNA
jgi:protein required for attachment to host cells